MASPSSASSIRSEVEEELRNQFRDLQVAVLDRQKKIRQIEAQLDFINKESLRNKLVRDEISGLDEDTRLYRSWGRMFYLQSKQQVLESIESKQKEREETTKELIDNKAYLEKGVKDKENNLREFINQNLRPAPASKA